jgi:hypothetical protein
VVVVCGIHSIFTGRARYDEYTAQACTPFSLVVI